MTDDLTDIKGVGPTIAANLRDAGFETVEEVLSASVADLVAADLVGESTAESILSGDDAGSTRGQPCRLDKEPELMDEIRAQLEKPISDRAAMAQSPINRTTHKEWMQKDGSPFEEYQAMYRDARAISEERLAIKGLEGDYDSSLVKFLLKATHDYDDKQTVEHEGDGMGNVVVSFTDDEETE